MNRMHCFLLPFAFAGCTSSAEPLVHVSGPDRLFAVGPVRPLSVVPTPAADAANAGHGRFEYVVATAYGAIELYDDDLIVIDEVRGTVPTFAPGGTYQIKGRYRLSSVDDATLLLSVTSTTNARAGSASGARVKRGEGAFTLDVTLHEVGYPHLTFYVAGKPVGGVYFGADEWLLHEKNWKYATPSPDQTLPDPGDRAFELL